MVYPPVGDQLFPTAANLACVFVELFMEEGWKKKQGTTRAAGAFEHDTVWHSFSYTALIGNIWRLRAKEFSPEFTEFTRNNFNGTQPSHSSYL